MAVYNGPKIVTSGLVLNLDAADRNSYPGSGTTWTDTSGNSNNGTLTNGPTFSSANQGSIVFDGVDDFVISPEFSIPTNNRTFETFIRMETLGSLANYTPILVQTSAFNNQNSNTLTGLQKISGAYRIIQPVGSGTAFGAYSGGFSYQSLLNQWMHVVGTIEGSVASKIYLNSVLVSNVAITINPQQISRFVMSGYFVGPQYDTGLLRVYNRALSAQEILQNYNATKTRFGL